MKNRLPLLIILIGSLFLSGCWDYLELENMAMTTAMGIDYDRASEKITVSVEIITTGKDGQKQGNGSGQGGEKSNPSGGVMVLSASDTTVYGAMEKIQQGVGKTLFFGYQEIIVVSEDAARNIMEDIIGLLDRAPLIPGTAYLIITSQRSEDVIATLDPAVPGRPSKNVYNLVKASGDSGRSSSTMIKDFAEAMAVSGIEPVAPHLIMESSGEGDTDASTGVTGGGKQPVRFVESKEGHHTVGGIAAFRGGKFAGCLNPEESIGWTLITGRNMKAYVKISPSGQASAFEIIDVFISKSKSSIKPALEGGKVTVRVDVEVRASMTKSKTDLDLLTPDVLSSVERQLSDTLKGGIEASLRKAQGELKSDIFGFGSAFHRKYPKPWHSKYEAEWEEMFPDIPVTVKVESKIINTGTTIRGFIAE